ncbi:MAG: leucine-rich repeat domain-containing protein [Ruminiclostridium sp.]|nr:leucine-rich repeat domain-containing protein [Ruminiclostridium sp.]
MKKFLTSVILLISAVMLCTAVAGAETYVDYGDYQYKIKRDGTIAITDYRGSATELEIPAEIDGMKVTEVEGYGFHECKTLVSVTIPYGVKKLGTGAFNECTSLENISIPDSVTVIGNDAFVDCISLRTIRLPESLQYIGSYAFYGCRLESVYIPDINLDIEGEAFSKGAYFICGRRSAAERYAKVYGLSYEYFSGEKPDNIVSQEMGGYRYEVLADNTVSVIGYLGKDERVIVPEKMNGMTVVKIADNAFSGTGVKSVTVPDSVQYIGRSFADCDKLEEIILPETLTELYAYAFEDCTSLKRIRLPKNLSASAIGIVDINNTIQSPFNNCTSLEAIEVDKENSELYSIDGVLFSKVDNRLMIYPAGKTDSVYEIPEGTKIIGDLSTEGYAVFQGNSYLERIIVPQSVTEIGRRAFSNIENKVYVEFPGEDYSAELNALAFDNSPGVIIKCAKGSSIHDYAATNEVNFELYGGYSPDSQSAQVLLPIIFIVVIPVLLIATVIVIAILFIKKKKS